MRKRDFQISGFGLPDLGENNIINRVLTSALQARGIDDSSEGSGAIYWDADYFDLHRVAIFQGASERIQQQILQQLTQDLLKESLWIEQAGMGYMAKMVLLAESSQERMLYSLFAADEASHFAQLRPYGPATPEIPNDAFFQLLGETMESEDKGVLLFVLQGVLEGWGLTHYRSLSKGCTHPTLGHLLRGFLQAESRHHGAGVTLFNQIQISANSRAAIVECLATFLQMVRVGPQRVVSAIATHQGHLSRAQRIQILQQLDTVAHSHRRLQRLRSLMTHGDSTIVEELERKHLFRPLSPEEAASYG